MVIFVCCVQMELAQMAETLFSRNGNIAFYACVIVYLYGDLAIYAVGTSSSPLSHLLIRSFDHILTLLKKSTQPCQSPCARSCVRVQLQG